MRRKEYGVLARDLGDVDLEDEKEVIAGQAKDVKAAEKTAVEKKPEPVKAVESGKEEATKEKVAGKDSKDQERKKEKEEEAQGDKQAIEAEEEEVSYDEVRDVEAEEVGEILPVKKRGRGRMLAVVVVVVAVLIPLLYFLVVPRTELTLKVYYNESLLNQINVDPELRNDGTVAVENVVLEISVVNSTDQQQGERNYTAPSIPPHSANRLEAITFRGSQYEDYTIIIDLSFSAGGHSYSEHWSHQTKEPWMNQDFTETVSGF